MNIPFNLSYYTSYPQQVQQTQGIYPYFNGYFIPQSQNYNFCQQYGTDFQSYQNYGREMQPEKTIPTIKVKDVSKESSKNKYKKKKGSLVKFPSLEVNTKSLWWKINVNLNTEEIDEDKIQLINAEGGYNRISNNNKLYEALAYEKSRNTNNNIDSYGSINDSSRYYAPSNVSQENQNSIIVIKKEDDAISKQPTSEELLHFINPNTKHHQTKLVFTDNVNANSDNKTDTVIPNSSEKQNEKEEKVVDKHCKEILSKFVINETSSNEYFSQLEINENELGKCLSTTVHFIIKEMNSIELSSNFLALKLSPRQKQDISILIINEINQLELSGDEWGKLCKLIVNTLNENFRRYFVKETKIQPNSKNEWLWLLDLANRKE